MSDFDLVIVGGGLAGSTLGLVMAREGARVLIVEKTKEFRDRIRGETTAPWGSQEARLLGVYDLLRDRCGIEVQYTTFWFGGEASKPRDLHRTTLHGLGNLNFKHPEMQQVLLEAASDAGAEVLRSDVVMGVAPGNSTVVGLSDKAGTREVTVRLVVGADGRNSKVRGWAGFEVLRDPTYLFAASALLQAPTDLAGSVHYLLDPVTPRSAFIVPVADGYFRPYLMYRNEAIGRRLSGKRDAASFIQNCVAVGAPKEWFEDVQIAGPLATFDGASRWVEHPYRDGVVLVGDAASSSDPSWGNGLSMTLRDVRLLGDRLCSNSDWRCAASDYASEQALQGSRLRLGEAILRDLFFEPGEVTLKHRYHAMELLGDEPDRDPDLFGLGPDAPCDDAARNLFFGDV